MARRSTVGSLLGAVSDSMSVVSDVATLVSSSVSHLCVATEALGYKAVVFRESAKLDSVIELGSMKNSKMLEAKLNIAKAQAESERLMTADPAVAKYYAKAESEVESWFIEKK